MGYSNLSVSINVSVIQFMKNNFISNLFNMIKEAGVLSKNVGIEITESIVAINFIAINNILWELRGAGISVYIDDFVQGYFFARPLDVEVAVLFLKKNLCEVLS